MTVEATHNHAEDLPADRESPEKVLARARARFKHVAEFEDQIRATAREDLAFLQGGEKQWEPQAVAMRKALGLPIHTFNMMQTFVDAVVGDMRMSNIGISVTGNDFEARTKIKNLDGTTDYNLAQIAEGWVRSVEYRSRAQTAYDHAGEQQIGGGFGYWRIVTERSPADFFSIDARIQKIFNQFRVYLDPNAMLMGPQHADYGFITTYVAVDPEDAGQEPEPTIGDDDHGYGLWQGGEDEKVKRREAEYYERVATRRTILLLSNGQQVWEDLAAPVLDELAAGGVAVVDAAEVDCFKVLWYRLAWDQIKKGPIEVPTQYIPIVPVYGKMINDGGKPVLRSLIYNGRDPQKAYNYWRTTHTEMTALAPKAPYVAGKSQIAGYEQQWENANRSTRSALIYDDSNNANPPRREQPPVASSAMAQEVINAREDLKFCIGLFDASLGNRGNEVSGRAILARQEAGDVGTYTFIDNQAEAKWYTGLVLVDMMPRLLDTERVVRMRNADDSEDYVTVNQRVVDQETGQVVRLYDLAWGRYDVSVSTGPAAMTQREKAADLLMQLMEKYPDAAPVIADVFAANLDFPAADELRRRLRKLVPPHVLAGDSEDEQLPTITPADVEQAIQQALQSEEMGLKAMKEQVQAIEAETAKVKAETANFEAAKAAAEAAMDKTQIQAMVQELVEEFLAGAMMQGSPATPATNAPATPVPAIEGSE